MKFSFFEKTAIQSQAAYKKLALESSSQKNFQKAF